MITTNLPSLKINKLTQEQYDAALAAGTINENEIYMTPAQEASMKAVQITIPKGRMRGDIDGDGYINDGKYDEIINNKYYNQKVDSANLDSWVCDLNKDGNININDANMIGKVPPQYTPDDYYNNWSWDSTSNRAYIDISVNSVTNTSGGILFINGEIPNMIFEAVASSGSIRLYSEWVPTTDMTAYFIIDNSVTNISVFGHYQYIPPTTKKETISIILVGDETEYCAYGTISDIVKKIQDNTAVQFIYGDIYSGFIFYLIEYGRSGPNRYMYASRENIDGSQTIYKFVDAVDEEYKDYISGTKLLDIPAPTAGPTITYSTTDLTAGTSALAEGTFYFVYE